MDSVVKLPYQHLSLRKWSAPREMKRISVRKFTSQRDQHRGRAKPAIGPETRTHVDYDYLGISYERTYKTG